MTITPLAAHCVVALAGLLCPVVPGCDADADEGDEMPDPGPAGGKSDAPRPSWRSDNLDVPLDPFEGGDQTLELRYYTSGDIVEDRDTLVLLNGGPGLESRNIRETLLAAELVDRARFNVISFDQRGWNKAYSRGDEGNRLFRMDTIVADIEALRRHIAADRPLHLVGHSFGASLAYQYATTHPEHTGSVVAISGSLDAVGFIAQKQTRYRVLAEAVIEAFESLDVDPALGVEAMRAYLAGEIMLDTFHTAPLRMFVNTSFGHAGFISAGSLASTVTRAAEQNFEFVTTHAAAFDRNDPEDMAQLEALVKEGIHRASNLDPDAEPSPVTGSLFGANEFIVCSELVTPEAIALATSEGLEPDEIEIHRRSVCDPLQIEQDRQFDLKPTLALIEAPVAVVAGRHDPTLYREFAQRDARLLRDSGVDAVYLEAQKAGHDTLSAQADCIASKLATFWEGDALQEDVCAFSLADLVGPFEPTG